MGKYKLFFLLMIFLCISCGNNKISIRVESALISSSDNQPLRSLTLENDSLLFTYQISLKDGYVGLSSINLNRINDAYVITYGNSIIENEKFHLQPDATYIISNYSIPDAKSHALEFKTNPRGDVKSVKEVKQMIFTKQHPSPCKILSLLKGIHKHQYVAVKHLESSS